MRLVQKRAESQIELRFLLNDDNYFSAMRNMWADFRSNLASRKNFDLLPLPDLYRRARENGAKRLSDYDVIAINMCPGSASSPRAALSGRSTNISEDGHQPARFPSLHLVFGDLGRA